MSPLLGVGLSEDAVETLDVRSWLGLCRTTSLLLTRGPLWSLTSEDDLTTNLDGSPPERARDLEGEWFAVDRDVSVCRGVELPASVLCSAIEGEEC